MANVTLHRGDDTDSFNGGLFKIDYSDPTFNIKKLEILMGNVIKTYVNPEFPLQVNLRSSESLINSTGTYDINLIISDSKYKKLNIVTGSTVTFAEPSTPIVIPYESPILFDLSEVLPTNTEPEPTPEPTPDPQPDPDDNNGDNTGDNTGEDDNTGGDDTNGNDDNTGDNTGGDDNTNTEPTEP